MNKIENVVEKFGTKLISTGLGWFDDGLVSVQNPLFVVTLGSEGHHVLDGQLNNDQVVVVNPVSRQFWAVDLELAAWVYEEEAPEGELLRRRLRLDRLNSSSWLHVGGDRGAGRHFDRDGKETEETRLKAEKWSRDGSWAKYGNPLPWLLI
jgi:hypothetical protein